MTTSNDPTYTRLHEDECPGCADVEAMVRASEKHLGSYFEGRVVVLNVTGKERRKKHSVVVTR